MIGNDLVDLNQAALDSNWQRRGYLSKVYTEGEQTLIAAAVNPTEMVWLLWSMKEAVYKIYSKLTGIRNYAPTALDCIDVEKKDKNFTGKVRIAGQLYYTQSDLHKSYVHTIAAANKENLPEIKVAIYEFPDNQFDYKSTLPKCVSHHGQYLALIY